ncbi:crAss001_48 related protein [Pseudomonas laurylsulfatiphila]
MTQDYIGTKQIVAWEQDSPKKVKVCGVDCKKGEASCNSYCTGGADRAPEQAPEPGYAVKYLDGYVSWSPKDVFEAAYLPMGHVGHLPLHQQRVIGEKVQLDDKIGKLSAFFDTSLFKGLPAKESELLTAQLGAMVEYSGLLAERIALF